MNYEEFKRRIRSQCCEFTLHLNRNKVIPNTYALDKLLKNEINYEKILNKSKIFPNEDVVLNYIDIHPDAANEIEQHLLKEDIDRKSTRLNSSHVSISYAVFCLKKKKKKKKQNTQQK